MTSYLQIFRILVSEHASGYPLAFNNELTPGHEIHSAVYYLLFPYAF
jgi:hypothetical protein